MNIFKKLFLKKNKEKMIKEKKANNISFQNNELKKLAIKKIKKIKKQRIYQKKFDSFAFVFRVFIEQKFHIKRSFTHEEFSMALNKKRINPEIKNRIINLSSEINLIEFAGKKIDNKKINALIKEFEELIKSDY